MAKEKKKVVVQTRVTTSMAQDIESVAKAEGATEAAVMRRYCIDGLKRDRRKLIAAK